jgi:hypothetical protein
LHLRFSCSDLATARSSEDAFSLSCVSFELARDPSSFWFADFTQVS